MPTSRDLVLHRPIDLPIDVLRSRIGSWSNPALLEGGPEIGPGGRWSIFAARPRRVIHSQTGEGFQWAGGSLDLDNPDDLFEGLAKILKHYRLAVIEDQPVVDDPPFRGGMIGYFGYDLAPRLEHLPRKADRDSRLPCLRFGLYDTFVLIDHQSQTTELWAVDLLNEGLDLLEHRWNQWKNDLAVVPKPRNPTSLSRLRAEWTADEYRDSVRKVLDYIEAGDIYQANLSQRFTAQGSINPLDLATRLREVSPAPYSAFLAFDDMAIISASPELFYRTEGDRIITRPIKGTRPRSADPLEDARLAAVLLDSVKDRAELTMIVDLERNDLGRVCQFGTVLVTEPGVIESFAEVHHLVATVEGRLRAGTGPIDVTRALFPGGSITGAPKIRAMEIIDELEPHRRSVYTGAIGYFSRGGRSAFNIAIRTILVQGDQVRFQVGGGIVADSIPEQEYAETLDKARGMRQVIEGAREVR